MPKPITTSYTLASGRVVAFPATIENVVGVDSEGRIVVDQFDAFTSEDSVIAGHAVTPFVFGLTLCCNAYDKGTEGGNVCRACYGSKRNADSGDYHFRGRDGMWPAEVDYVVGTPFLTALAEPFVMPESHPIGFSAQLAEFEATTPAPPTPTVAPAPAAPTKEKRMNKKTPAADQFRALGLTDESVWTDTMNVAVKQRWSDLPVGEKVGDLRDRLAALTAPVLPSQAEVMTTLLAKGAPVSVEDAEAELARLKRNANVNAWRARKQIQAAIDARDLKFAALRAKRSTGAPKSVTGDAPAASAVA